MAPTSITRYRQTPGESAKTYPGYDICTVGETEPLNPHDGDLWLDTATAGGTAVLNYITTTTDLTLTSSHTVVYCDALNGPIVLTLPAASSNGGRLYVGVKVDSSANTVTISNGEFSAVLTVQDEAVPVSSNGTAWRVIF